MKGSYWFTLFIVLFLGLMFVVEYHLPKKFVWTPTFSRYDNQPFGCSVFDEVVINSWPEDTYYSENTFYQLSKDTTQQWSALAIAERIDLSRTDVDALLEFARRGNKALLVSSSFGQLLSDTLQFKMVNPYFTLSGLKRYAGTLLMRDSLSWVGDSTAYAPRNFEFYPQLCSSYFLDHDSLAQVLVMKSILFEVDSQDTEKARYPIALSYSIGDGEIILVSTPLLFTNYGILDGDNAAYIFRLLSRIKDFPLIRTEAYGVGVQEQQSPFRYFLSQPALRWGLYLAVITLVLFMIFTARRKQRPIPVITEPANKMFEFVRLIGTLYYLKNDHNDLILKKFTYFSENLRRTIQVDVEDESDDPALCHKIATKTGVGVEKIEQLFRHLRPIIRGEREVSEPDMKEYMDRMNEITNHL